MKKKIRRLRLDRETVRNLTPEHMEQVAGGTGTDFDDSRANSCDFGVTRPYNVCFSRIVPLLC